MGNLRLQSKINELKKKVNVKEVNLTLYIVPDLDAMINDLEVIKRILKHQKWIFVISTTGEQALSPVARGRFKIVKVLATPRFFVCFTLSCCKLS